MTTHVDAPVGAFDLPRAEEPVQEGLDGIDQLLRRPVWFVAAAAEHPEPARILRVLLVTVLAGAAIFGAAMGVYRPGWQILSSLVKLPLVLLFSAGLTVPAYAAARWASGARLDPRKDILLFVATLALVSLVLAALAPVVLLAVLTGFGYHATILVVTACAAVAGLVAVVAFVRTQMAWTLRPFVARPRADFEVVRTVEGGFVDAVHRSAESARGRYRREAAPLPGDSW